MLFEWVRLSLFERGELFIRLREDGTPFGREEWLRTVFRERITFTHFKKDFIYVPDDEIEHPHVVVGRIGREKAFKDATPPHADHPLRERVTERWQSALVLLDPRHHADGQKLAVERKPQIGSNAPRIVQALVDAINTRSLSEPFIIEAHPIADPSGFWDYVHANPGRVTSITLEVAAPNILGTADEFASEMKSLRDNERVRHSKFQFNNDDGLNPDTARFREAVEYAVKGGGAVKAKAQGKPGYNSRGRTQKVKVEIVDDTGKKQRILYRRPRIR